MIFLAPLYNPANEPTYLKKNREGLPNASNQFQLSMIRGFKENYLKKLFLINALPFGTWPTHYKQFKFKSLKWNYLGYDCLEIPSMNLPLVKQLQREWYMRRLLQRLTKEDKEIIIYSTYLPFLRAVSHLPQDVKITLIVTDLPEFYDLRQVSLWRKILRKLNNIFIYQSLKRINRFVLLTEQMKKILKVQDRPYVIVEGIVPTSQAHDNTKQLPIPTNKEIIFYSGTLHYQFGIKTLLDAFAQLTTKNVELWICGAGESEKEVRRRAQLDSRIHFWGYLSSQEVNRLRANATVLVNPRPNEGEYTKYSFPSKTMESLASGIPVVMYKLDGIPNEYAPYLIYISGRTPGDMVAAFQTVFSMSSTERKEFAEKAKQFVIQHKNAKIQMQKILDMIRIK